MLEEQACFIGLYKYIAKILKVIDNWINEWIIHAAEGRFLGGGMVIYKILSKMKMNFTFSFCKIGLDRIKFSSKWALFCDKSDCQRSNVLT